MPTWVSTVPNLAGLSVEKQVAALVDAYIEQDKRLRWITSRLDSKNVKRLDTNETVIKSADGETIINGPVLEMYDKQATPKLRLKQGYDSVTGDFVYNLYNKAGTQTVGIDSSGNATFTGSISASTITGGTITGGAISGGTIDGTTITGTTITGGTIQTAVAGNNRIVITGNKLETYNSGNALSGIAWGVGLGTFGDVSFYDAGTLTMQISNIGGGGGWTIEPRTTGKLVIGIAAKTVECRGTWDFGTAPATVTGLSADSAGTHNHGIPDGTVLAKDGGGTVTFAESGAHTHTVS